MPVNVRGNELNGWLNQASSKPLSNKKIPLVPGFSLRKRKQGKVKGL